MTSDIFIIFIVVLPIAILAQFARSSRLPKQHRHIGADLVESAGLALGMSLSIQGSTIFPQWHSLFRPLCYLCAVIFRFVFWQIGLERDHTMMPNKSPEPNPIGAFGNSRTPVAYLVSDSGWLSFCR